MTDISRDELIALTAELVGIASENPPGEEADVATAIAERIEASPVDFELEVSEVLPDRPNVVARAGDPDQGTVLLTGHTDVVPAEADQWSGDPNELREEDGKLIGRGVADMKAALAAKLLASEAYLTGTDDPGEVVLGFVVDEEHLGRGTRAMIEGGIDADAAIVGEPTELDTCVAQKGVARYRVRVEGENAHSGTPDEGTDAIRAAGRLLVALESLDGELRDEWRHELLAPETITVTEIEGGIAPNVVADRVELVADWRFLPGRVTSPDPFDDRIERLVSSTDLEANVDVDIERTVFARSAEIPADDDLVKTVVEAAADASVESEPLGFNAATDARFLVHDADVPTVLFGPGSIENDAHTVDESIAVDSLVATARVYRNALDRLLG